MRFMHIADMFRMNKITTWFGETTEENIPVIRVDANVQSFGRIATSAHKVKGLEIGDLVLLKDLGGDVEDEWLATFVDIDSVRAYFLLKTDGDSQKCCRNCGAVQ